MMTEARHALSDAYSSYESGTRLLLDKLGRDHPRYTETLTYEQRLLENIAQTRQHGDTETLRAERSQIIESLNRLAMETEGVSFNELCGLGLSPEPLLPIAPPSVTPQEWRELGILLEKVKQFWVKGVLEKSVYNEVLLELGKEVDIETVEHPWERVLELPGQTRTLPPDKSILEIFDETGRTLLILGEPGSGKTITLLELTRDLINRAEHDETFSQPIPVVFNLSSWTDPRQPLIDWMVAELSVKYQIPKRIGRPWLEDNRLLPLLDGLDEVRPENRAACVEAINYFGKEFGLAGLAVCSRLKEYTDLLVRLKLNSAIRLLPLSPGQVDDYLVAAGPELGGLSTTIREDKNLQTLAQSPLMLNIMSLAYQGIEVQPDQDTDSLEASRGHLFDTYIERMFKRRGTADRPYDDRKTTAWLSWLAQKMTEHNQTIFLMEGLQPSWLSSRCWRWTYVLGSRLIVGLLYGLLVGLLYGLLYGLVWGLLAGLPVGLLGGLSAGLIDSLRFARSGKTTTATKAPTYWQSARSFLIVWLLYGLVYGLAFGLFYGLSDLVYLLLAWLLVGLLGGLSAGLIDSLRFARSGKTTTATKAPTYWQSARSFLIVWLLFGLLYGLLYGLLGGLNILVISEISEATADERLVFGLLFGLVFGLLFGLPFGLISGLRGSQRSPTDDIQTVEAPSWSWGKAWLGIVRGILFGLVFGLVVGLPFGLSVVQVEGSDEGLISGPIGGPIPWLICGLLFGLVGGLTGAGLSGLGSSIVGTKTTPNQGIRLSLKNSMLVGLLVGLLGGLIGGLVLGLVSGLRAGLIGGLIGGPLIGLIGALWYGGLDVIQHYTLRLILWYRGHTPRNYAHLLDYAAERIFLQKVGGGYVFVHRLLLEHFAELDQGSSHTSDVSDLQAHTR